MSTVSCCVCGTDICLTADQEHYLRRTKHNFYCPSGHTQYFAGGCEHKKELDAEKAKYERWIERLTVQIDRLHDEARMCPWPTCRRAAIRHIYSRPDNLIAHLERAHGMPTYRALKAVAS